MRTIALLVSTVLVLGCDYLPQRPAKQVTPAAQTRPTLHERFVIVNAPKMAILFDKQRGRAWVLSTGSRSWLPIAERSGSSEMSPSELHAINRARNAEEGSLHYQLSVTSDVILKHDQRDGSSWMLATDETPRWTFLAIEEPKRKIISWDAVDENLDLKDTAENK